jgi:response regulator RpfG family c-di-GMP phosphodiesterase
MNNSRTIKAGRFKVLYIDDDPLQLQLFQLRYSNIFKVKVAEFAQNGLEILKNNKSIDVVISDFDMPFMNGLEFIEKARKIKNDIPFFILSCSLKTDEIREALKNKLINNFLRKPLSRDEILNEISKYYEYL